MRTQPLLFSLFIILVFGGSSCLAQKIEINTSRAKESYQVGETILKQNDVKQRMASDQASLDKFASGQAWNAAGIGVCGAGGAVLVSGVALAIDNSVKNEVLYASEKIDDSLSWTLVGVGIGAMIPGAIMILHGRNQRIKAVKSFNGKVDGSANGYQFQLRPSSQGIGLALRF
jgi:hypothetical protein